MATQTLPRTEPDTQTDSPRKRLFTRKEYHAMGKAGIFGHQERVELLKGEIIAMSPAGDRHSACIVRLNRVFAGLNIANRTLVSVQSPVVTSPTSEPEPDFMLLTFRDDLYDFGKPRPQDVLLLIEVADSSLDYDRNVKLPYYAEVGIPEVWIANLRDDRIESYTDPSPEGYRVSRIYRPGDTISPTSFPDIEIAVNSIIPSRPPEQAGE